MVFPYTRMDTASDSVRIWRDLIQVLVPPLSGLEIWGLSWSLGVVTPIPHRVAARTTREGLHTKHEQELSNCLSPLP